MKEAALSLPKELDDPKLGDELKTAITSAKESYTTADQLYTDVNEGTGTPQVDRDAASVGRIYAAYGTALLACHRRRENRGHQSCRSQIAQRRDAARRQSVADTACGTSRPRCSDNRAVDHESSHLARRCTGHNARGSGTRDSARRRHASRRPAAAPAAAPAAPAAAPAAP